MSNKVPQIRFNGYSDDWEQRKLGKVFKTYSGMTPLRSDISNFRNPEVPWIKTTDLKNSDITSNDEKISAKAANKLKVLPVNTVLIAMYGGFNQIGRTGLLTYPATINQALTALEPNDSISPYFLLTELNYRVNDWKKFAASSRKDPNITKRDIDNFMINFPTQQEQQKVGSFFKQLDDTIALHQRKLAKLKELKQGYLQKLFPKNGSKFPQLRFAGFADAWEQRKLGDLLKEFSIKSKIEDEHKVLSSTNSGMEFREGRVSGTSNLGYKIIKNGDLVLSPQNLWLGNININNIGKGLVSPSYKTFELINIDSSFINPQLRTQKMLEEYKNSSTQGASVVRRNLEIDSFYQIKIFVPAISEQEKIGSFFKQLDKTIALHQRKLDLLKEQKKGFLQKMFV